MKDGLVENVLVEMRVDEMMIVDGIVNFVVDVKFGYWFLLFLIKFMNFVNVDKGYV